MCKLVTVNCLSQYSGCKCILTYTNKTVAISQAYSHTSLLMWTNAGSSDDRHITLTGHKWSAECVFPSISYLCYNSEILGWCKTEKSVSFLVCVVVLQMSTVILCEKVPQQCTAWIIMCPIHCELMGKEKKIHQPINFDFSFGFGSFPDVHVFLSYHVWLVFVQARHAFHQQSHCVN